MGVRLTDLARPFVVCVITDTTAADAESTMQGGVAAGADAFELNLPFLAREEPSLAAGLFAASRKPTYTSCRRADFMTAYGRGAVPVWDDEERMRRQLSCLELGSVAADVEMDAFDEPSQEGVSWDAAAVREQRSVAHAIDRLGGEALMSCHAGRSLSAEEIVAIGHAARERGGRLLKVVTAVVDRPQAMQALMGAVRLHDEGVIPATVIAAGMLGRFTRVAGPMLTHGWALCQQQCAEGGFRDQPLVATMSPIVHWLTDQTVEKPAHLKTVRSADGRKDHRSRRSTNARFST